MIHIGCVENRNDPLRLGRCKVRIVGLHTEDKTVLPTDDLPWAYPMMPISSASMNGIGWSPTGVVQGSWVICTFLDDAKQQPIMMGTIGGIPSTKTAAMLSDLGNVVITTDESGELVSSDGESMTNYVESIISEENKQTSVQQVEGSKYKLMATTVDGITTYSVTNRNGNVIATVTYDETTTLYSVVLKSPESYSQEQYLPFTDVTPKMFETQDQIINYFDTNF